MLEACRTCLRLINIDNSPFYEIEADDMQLSAGSCRSKLLSIVPEMALNITPKPMLCAECHGSLEALYEFKEKCLKTENIIAQYFQTRLDLDVKNFDLKDVLALNNIDIKPSVDELVKLLSEEVAVKEEVELCDTAIVKHEVDDFSSESAEVLWPKNEAPSSNFTCEYSDERCKTPSSLKIHLYTHTDEKLHRCEICGHQFTKKHHLTVHLRTHTGERPYVCAVCGKGFPSKFQITVHMRTHTGEKPYGCEMCDRSFAHKSNLTTHIQIHTGERLYVCTVCGNNYSSRSYLKKHSCTLKKEQPHQCETNSSLVIHNEKISRSKNLQCEHCKKLCWHKQHLQRHIMTVHKDVDVLVKRKNKSFIEQKESQNSFSLPLEQ